MCGEQQGHPALVHAQATAVVARSGDTGGPVDADVVGAVHFLAAEVEKDEEIIVAVVMIDIGAFDCIEVGDAIGEVLAGSAIGHLPRGLVELDDVAAG